MTKINKLTREDKGIEYIKNLLEYESTNSNLSTFSYFISCQDNSLYNLGNYTSQIKKFEAHISIFKDNHNSYCEFFDLFERKLTECIHIGLLVNITIDNIYILHNKIKDNQVDLRLRETDNWKLEFNNNLSNRINLNEISNNNIIIRIEWENEKPSETTHINNNNMHKNEITFSINISKLKQEGIKSIYKLFSKYSQIINTRLQ